MDKKVRIEKRERASESILYWKKVIEMLKRQVEVVPREESMQLQTAEKKSVASYLYELL